jgi:hypothetical protein
MRQQRAHSGSCSGMTEGCYVQVLDEPYGNLSTDHVVPLTTATGPGREPETLPGPFAPGVLIGMEIPERLTRELLERW